MDAGAGEGAAGLVFDGDAVEDAGLERRGEDGSGEGREGDKIEGPRGIHVGDDERDAGFVEGKGGAALQGRAMGRRVGS